MRILFLAYRDFTNPSAVGGDIYLWELARGLRRLGNHVTFVCSQFQGSKPVEFVDGVQIIRIKGLLSLPLRIFSCYFKYLRSKYDVIVEEAIGGQRPPFLAGIYVKEPLVAVWHQKHDKIFREQYPFPVSLFLSLFEVFLARLYKNRIIVTPSKGSKNKLLELGFKEEKIKVVYDGVGEIFSHARIDKKKEDIMVCLGKLRRYKRFDHAILALKYLIDNGLQNCRLIIAGKVSEIDTGYINELKNLVEKLGISNYVKFRLNISEKEKLELLEKARILVQPSPVEGFSIVVAEANKCCTPVVVSDGIPNDVVINEYNGLVYPFGDIKGLTSALHRLMTNHTLWYDLSKNAYTHSKQFTWENSAYILYEVLKKICIERSSKVQIN